jgi:hypothetical protein
MGSQKNFGLIISCFPRRSKAAVGTGLLIARVLFDHAYTSHVTVLGFSIQRVIEEKIKGGI